jgi:hypothetical protein
MSSGPTNAQQMEERDQVMLDNSAQKDDAEAKDQTNRSKEGSKKHH